MSRELVVQLIARKKSLYQEQHDLALKKLAIENDLSYCAPQLESRIEEDLLKANDEQLAVKAKIYRAHLFGQRHTKSLVPSYCPVCFIDRNQLTPMKEVESIRGNGIRQFQCETCSHELLVNPPLIQHP